MHEALQSHIKSLHALISRHLPASALPVSLSFLFLALLKWLLFWNLEVKFLSSNPCPKVFFPWIFYINSLDHSGWCWTSFTSVGYLNCVQIVVFNLYACAEDHIWTIYVYFGLYMHIVYTHNMYQKQRKVGELSICTLVWTSHSARPLVAFSRELISWRASE